MALLRDKGCDEVGPVCPSHTRSLITQCAEEEEREPDVQGPFMGYMTPHSHKLAPIWDPPVLLRYSSSSTQFAQREQVELLSHDGVVNIAGGFAGPRRLGEQGRRMDASG